jgi:hypothetical protein
MAGYVSRISIAPVKSLAGRVRVGDEVRLPCRRAQLAAT